MHEIGLISPHIVRYFPSALSLKARIQHGVSVAVVSSQNCFIAAIAAILWLSWDEDAICSTSETFQCSCSFPETLILDPWFKV